MNPTTASVSNSQRLCSIAAITAVIGVCGTAMAQNQERRFERAVRQADPAERFRVDPSLNIAERSQIDVGGSAALNFIHLNDAQDNSRRLFQPEITLYGRAVIDSAHLIFARARFQYRDFSEGDSFDGRGDQWQSPYLDRYWYEFDLRRAAAAYDGETLSNNFNIRVGRQFVDWGAGLTLSENLYAVRPSVEFGRFLIEGLAGVTPADRSVVDFDASREGFNNHTERGFFGGRASYRLEDGKEFYVLGLHQADYNTGTLARVGALGPVDFEYDSSYIGIGASGSIWNNWLYLGEFVYQLGESMSDPIRGPQTSEDINAWAARAQLTWILADRNFTRFELEGSFASGDDDRLISTDTVGGNLSGTNDTGFNSLGFQNTGLAFAPALSNLMAFRIGASTFPLVDVKGLEQFQIGADFFFLNKLDHDAPIEELTTSDLFLGFEMDWYVNYRVTSDFALTGRYGVFFAGDAIVGNTEPRHFIFLGAVLSF